MLDTRSLRGAQPAEQGHGLVPVLPSTLPWLQGLPEGGFKACQEPQHCSEASERREVAEGTLCPCPARAALEDQELRASELQLSGTTGTCCLQPQTAWADLFEQFFPLQEIPLSLRLLGFMRAEGRIASFAVQAAGRNFPGAITQ